MTRRFTIQLVPRPKEVVVWVDPDHPSGEFFKCWLEKKGVRVVDTYSAGQPTQEVTDR